jgi:hypothetical protein
MEDTGLLILAALRQDSVVSVYGGGSIFAFEVSTCQTIKQLQFLPLSANSNQMLLVAIVFVPSLSIKNHSTGGL